MRQRPDIRAAEALLHQASAQIGVATANLYPQITLTGSFGAQATQLQACSPARASGASAPACCSRSSTAASSSTSAAPPSPPTTRPRRSIAQTVLLAFQNVADALRALEDDARTLKAQADAEAARARDARPDARASTSSAPSATSRCSIAQRQYQQARLALVQAQAARYADTAALFQALGGGWWNARRGRAPAIHRRREHNNRRPAPVAQRNA